MIPTPPGWSALAVGRGLLLTRDGDASRGSLQYVERLRPLRDAAEVASEVGVPAGFRALRTATERGATVEGELTELVVQTGILDGAEVELYVGVVSLDDYYARLTGIALAPRCAPLGETVRDLLARDVHMLGALRRRRYRYQVPAGWTETRELFQARLDAPSKRARIFVAAAVPAQPGLEATMLARLARGAARVAGWSREPARAITTAWGLSGRLHRGGDGATDDHVAFLEHAGLAYAVRLADRRGTSSVSVLRALLDSIEPIVVTGASGGAAAALHHWAA